VRSVTLRDVAVAAEVSTATASRALSGKNRVSPETVERVRTAAEHLGYRVDPIARALREGSTRIIGMIVPVIANPFFAQLVDAVEQGLQERGFELLLADSHGVVSEEARRLRVFQERKVDGIILVPSDSNESVAAIRAVASRTPVVQIDRPAARSIADFVGVDNIAGVSLVLGHLAAIGTRSIVYVGADDANTSGVDRWEAVRAVAADLALDVMEPYRDAFDVETGLAAADRLLKQDSLPDAIVTGADLIAFGVIAGLRERGTRVPEDVVVTGFDGTLLSSIFSPTLTTVVQPVEAIAAEAIGFLLSRIGGTGSPARNNRIAPSLRIGASTGRVRTSD
jgi:LacI family transcriptional regulator